MINRRLLLGSASVATIAAVNRLPERSFASGVGTNTGRTKELLAYVGTSEPSAYLDYLNRLSSVATLVAPGETLAVGEMPQIVNPIDSGAKNLLEAERSAILSYDPYDVEFLINSLNSHISSCIDLREKAHQLQALSIVARQDILLETELLAAKAARQEFDNSHENDFLGTMFKPMTSGQNFMSSDVADYTAYTAKRVKFDDSENGIRSANLRDRAMQLSISGSSFQYVERYAFLKKIFDAELIEAYRKAYAASLGIRDIYQVSDAPPLPPIVDVGYLGELASWAQAVTYMLEKELLGYSKTVVVFKLSKGDDVESSIGLFKQTEFNSIRALPNPLFQFNLKKESFDAILPSFTNLRLRGLGIYLTNKTDSSFQSLMDAVRVSVQLPQEELFDKPPGTANRKQVKINSPSVQFGTSSYFQGQGFDVRPLSDVHNATPLGTWQISVDPKTLFGKLINAPEVCDNVIIAMLISYRRSGG